MFHGQNGQWSPLGIDTNKRTCRYFISGNGKMASGARWGLIPAIAVDRDAILLRQNGQWSPLGIDTARGFNLSVRCLRQNGQWSPLGIDTIPIWSCPSQGYPAKWPVEPVGD